MTTFRQLLDQFEASAVSRSAKGRAFEDFTKTFFGVDPYWSARFEDVWMWSDWEGRNNRPDTGIDLVAKERGTGALVAIQCKFYSPDATLSWGHVATFAGMLSQPEFSEGIIVSTAGSESGNLHTNLELLAKPVRLWRVADFEQSRVDWDQFNIKKPTDVVLREPKTLFDHQKEAIKDVVQGFETAERGQLIMACGTGKTFTALRLAEQMVGAGGSVLFLVPSINLLSQSVLAWANDTETKLSTFAVCSDPKAGQRRSDNDINAYDLAFPASTNPENLLVQVEAKTAPDRMTVVFSTYQSIDVIAEAQKLGLADFDLIICDEAHRTTGAFTDDDDQSVFTKIHDNNIVAGQQRLYMTATPRIYGDQAKTKAAEAEILVASMDDPTVFGEVFHELGFGEAVARGLLTDYKVLVLAVNEEAVAHTYQQQFVDLNQELPLNDMARLIGCWHGLSKQGRQFEDDNKPMERAVAFSSTIKKSKAFTDAFPELVNTALEDRSDTNAVKIEAQHVDGTTNVKVRSEAIAWLEEPPGQRVCRVLSNARCLTEGVDVPALDAVMFLDARKSIVDVVQAVGRVMRRSPGKDYGYVILPIAVPAGIQPEEALKNHENYKVVWQVLQALRSHDERLAAEINKIDINRTSSLINVIGIGLGGGSDIDNPETTIPVQGDLALTLPDLRDWRDALYARIVERVGDRNYMTTWANDIAAIAAAQETRIRALLDHPQQNPEAVARFDEFHTALQQILNDGVTKDDTIGMLSQHLITRPVFEALFGSGVFTQQNPVSQAMQNMIDLLDTHNLQTETKTLEDFYDHIRTLISGINTAEGRQQVITRIYEQFFKKALPKTAESLGIVYTPIEIVDFINRSVNQLLQQHFDGTTISDPGVHVLDPFTGTGTFIARLLQTGLIKPEDLQRKYQHELHANEIMLLAYYIAAINIENTYTTITNPTNDTYTPFEGIVLTDTFTLTNHTQHGQKLFAQNNQRADHQQQLDIRVILGNPPYSAGQTSQNDANQNLKYPSVDKAIEDTYAKYSPATNKNSLYDSYLRAFRWASDRIASSPNGGIIGFVTNNGWLNANTAAGVRKVFAEEFDYIYVFNLRGNSRTQGELAKAEGGNVFDVRVGISITILVKQPNRTPNTKAVINYLDIGDYLSKHEKLDKLSATTIDTSTAHQIVPNKYADWLDQRDERYQYLIPLTGTNGVFKVQSNGLKTNRDPWVYNSSRPDLIKNVEQMISFYNTQLDAFWETNPTGTTVGERTEEANRFVDKDPTSFSWARSDFARLAAGNRLKRSSDVFRLSIYRPFFKQHIAFDRTLNEMVYQLGRLFPYNTQNPLIGVVASGSKSPFSAVATDLLPCLHLINSDLTMGYARWYFEEAQTGPLFQNGQGPSLQRVSNINPDFTNQVQQAFGTDVSEDQIFSYVYGVLHSPEFRTTFETNLKKEAPRVPLVDNRETFLAFSNAGQQLLDLHIDYETVEPYPLKEVWVKGTNPDANPQALLVGTKKMRYLKTVDPETNKKVDDKTRLRYNDYLTLEGIPPEAHDYVLGTRSGIDWIIDRYYVKTDKASGIVNDPNQWGLEQNQPRYIIDLIGRVVTVSLNTVEIVKQLPTLKF